MQKVHIAPHNYSHTTEPAVTTISLKSPNLQFTLPIQRSINFLYYSASTPDGLI